jgi:adenylosuccinate synthase
MSSFVETSSEINNENIELSSELDTFMFNNDELQKYPSKHYAFIGADWGDEGKGKVVYSYSLNSKNNIILGIRYNGTGNAGHTIYVKDEHSNTLNKCVTHIIPCTILAQNKYAYIYSNCLIDIKKMISEIEDLSKNNLNIKGKLYISKACHIILQDHIDEDKRTNTVGTTGVGNGPANSDKVTRKGVRIEDLKVYESDEVFENQLQYRNIHFDKDNLRELRKLFIAAQKTYNITIVDHSTFWTKTFLEICQKYKTDHPNQTEFNVAFEGAQGMKLDINKAEDFPYCTSSGCGLGYCVDAGFKYDNNSQVVLICKLYSTYVGAKIYTPNIEIDIMISTLLQIIGGEYGATTGRNRQCNYLDLYGLVKHLKNEHATHCIINKIDIYHELVRKLHSNDPEDHKFESTKKDEAKRIAENDAFKTNFEKLQKIVQNNKQIHLYKLIVGSNNSTTNPELKTFRTLSQMIDFIKLYIVTKANFELILSSNPNDLSFNNDLLNEPYLNETM